MGGHELKVFRIHLIFPGGCIPSERSSVKIFLGQPEVGFIGRFVGILEFKFQFLPNCCFRPGIQPDLCNQVILVKAGIASVVQVLETIGIVIEVFQGIAKILPAVAQLGVQPAGCEASITGGKECPERIRDLG